MINGIIKEVFSDPIGKLDQRILGCCAGGSEGQQLWEALAVLVALLSVWGPTWWGISGLAWAAVLAPLLILPTPWKLSFRGLTSPLSFTPRAGRAYAGIFVVQILAGVLGLWLLGPAGVLIPLLLGATLSDLALGGLWYLERSLSMKFVRQAQTRLKKVKPTVVAITGSYGKTSTKGYVAHIVG